MNAHNEVELREVTDVEQQSVDGGGWYDIVGPSIMNKASTAAIRADEYVRNYG